MTKSKNPIPEDIAIKICQEIQKKNKEKKISWSKCQCWGCMKFSKYDDRGSCIYGDPTNLRGCQLVNKIYDKYYAT